MTRRGTREQISNSSSSSSSVGGGGSGGGGGGGGSVTSAGWMVQAGGGGGGRAGAGDRMALVSALTSPDTLEALAQFVAQELLDDAILNVVFEVHQSVKTGLLVLEMGSLEEDTKFLQVSAEGLDVFGQAPVKKQQECVCPSCSRNLAASRFAPHLEKCMGMGRNSSRIASRRIQNSTKENSGGGPVGGGGAAASDDDEDEDWLLDRKRKKRDKNSPRRSKNAKAGDGVSSSGSNSNNNSNSSSVESTLASGSAEEKRAMFKQICGVISEHTRKMCTRSLRCPQHSSEQRQAVRDQVLSGADPTTTTRAADSTTLTTRGLGADGEDIQVDIDGLDEGQLATSWDNDHSNTTSPADSTSTNNSTSSLARRTKTKKKSSSSSKSSKSSSSSHGSLLD
ncbi:ataxin-7-like protein 3 isoform X2 [Portunus trituberculatus]|uniref:ataxin-7-like protein 3 isoform X2 n=1 Tax=Portunus trituberculatus TaxID=210409 RepID=UPI001E1CFA56|nr:ataxin-7-like protein 3 isoform X2 [Portunus trituberculatus]